ncbi:Satratoxin biosynthesis SC1 cluster protein 4 [Pseudocercospora fuligena]|uniref:Satratoxin biosynthesis SC1 cluster protein 4 n=1 Tax=Pseudocercospora fuligena TaxID=685502 RepID=A0A8H6VMN7_9PEZI|nr:Satratoxin biosynthesis SC1 cluster protein 4 [Pseudocercospora fuligena]
MIILQSRTSHLSAKRSAEDGHATGTAVIVTIITFTSIAALLTALRVYTRIKISKNAGIDDWLVIASVGISIGVTVTMSEQVQYGMGKHFSTLPTEDKIVMNKWFWASTWNYALGLGVVKLSILFQYLRFIPIRSYRVACYVLMVFNVGWTLFGFFACFFMCTPAYDFWRRPPGEGNCLDRMTIWYTMAGGNIFTDIVITILPIPPLSKLNFPRLQKIILMVVFGVGGITCIMSILRLPALYKISESLDPSWNNPTAAIWSSMELNTSIITCNIPTLKGLVSRLFPAMSFGDSYIRTRSNQIQPISFTNGSSSGGRTLRDSMHTEKARVAAQELELRIQQSRTPMLKESEFSPVPSTPTSPLSPDFDLVGNRRSRFAPVRRL